MTGSAMTATKLRLLLIIGMAMLAVVSSAAFYFIQQRLAEYASEISVLNATAKSGNSDLQTLRSLETRLDEERNAITKARSIVADSQQYRYQDQIVTDIARIAGDSGVVVTQFDFSGASTGGTTTPTTPTPQPSTTTPGSSATGTSSLKSETVNVTIKSPVSYNALMNFIKAIETNPTKMQIATISMTADAANPSQVSPQSFTIKVYVR